MHAYAIFMTGLVDRATANWDLLLGSGLVYAVAAHAVNTFPVPENPIGRWFLGCVQYAFAFKGRAANTFQNQDTVTIPTPKKNGNGNGTGNGASITGANPIPSPTKDHSK